MLPTHVGMNPRCQGAGQLCLPTFPTSVGMILPPTEVPPSPHPWESTNPPRIADHRDRIPDQSP